MISRLTGTLEEYNITSIVLDVNGMGYEVLIPFSTADKLPPLHSKLTLLTHFHLREDAATLFGFLTSEERELFRLLINNVGGIGPKLALNVLSAMSFSVFSNAIQQNDIKLLSKINGIGKKTAERMIVELRDKIGTLGTVPGAPVLSIPGFVRPQKNAEDAIAALETLGFKKEIAAKAVSAICDADENKGENLSAEALIRRSLSTLNS